MERYRALPADPGFHMQRTIIVWGITMKKNRLYTILMLFFGAMFVCSAAVLGSYWLSGQRQENRYDELAQMLPPVSHALPESPAVPETEAPITVDGQVLQPRFLQLYDLNPDIVGWLEIPGTKVNYPVMQTPEDPEYYLKRDFDKKHSQRGCLFAQGDADVFAPSDNITIYGHRMKDNSMFGSLDLYRKKAFYEAHPYLYFDTLRENHSYQILAVFKTTVSEGEGFHYHEFVDGTGEAEFAAYVAQCKALSLYDTGVDAAWGDKLITLSTCEYSQTNGRLVVVAKQIS